MRFLPMCLQSERKDQIFPGTASRVSLRIAAADTLIKDSLLSPPPHHANCFILFRSSQALQNA